MEDKLLELINIFKIGFINNFVYYIMNMLETNIILNYHISSIIILDINITIYVNVVFYLNLKFLLKFNQRIIRSNI